jgi:glycosyltransferase involved in cell wall biosynthesis
MKLLICTQKLDPGDPVLGFFARWVEEFKKHGDVEVITLSRLGTGKVARALNLLRFAATLKYDAVFVHMNPEYLVVAGWLWRLMGKKTALWYTHKSVNAKLRIATLFANVILTASKESFRLRSPKVHVMGHGIDTDFFCPDRSVARGEHWLSVGRLMPSKRHDLAIREAARAGRELYLAGEGPERARLGALARECGASVVFLGPLTQAQLRDEYRRAALLVHRSETGSLDKVVLEAAACGLPVDTTDPALGTLPLSPQYVRERHSLAALIPRILEVLI